MTYFEIFINNIIFIIISTVLIIFVLKYISSNIYFELSEIISDHFENELKKIEEYNNEQITIIIQNSKIIETLSRHMTGFDNKLKELESNIISINETIQQRKSLENEIIKLKNIIRRIEKRRN